MEMTETISTTTKISDTVCGRLDFNTHALSGHTPVKEFKLPRYHTSYVSNIPL